MKALRLMRELGFEHYSIFSEAFDAFVMVRLQIARWRWAQEKGLIDGSIRATPRNNQRPRLSELVCLARNRECSDPKDKVFGLYRILVCFNLNMPPPDCSTDLPQIYQEATKAAINTDGCLEILYEIIGPRLQDKLPSWVPDYEYGYGYSSFSLKMPHYKHIAGLSLPVFGIDSSQDLLRLCGAVASVIRSVGCPTSPFDDFPFFTCFMPKDRTQPETFKNKYRALQVLRSWAQLAYDR